MQSPWPGCSAADAQCSAEVGAQLFQPGLASAFGREQSDEAAELDRTGAANGVALNQWTDVIPDQPVPPGHRIARVRRPAHRSAAELVDQVPHAVGEDFGVAALV